MGAVTAYIKPTNYCNVGCTHCYLPEAVRADRRKMSEAVLRKTGELLAAMVRGRRVPHAHVIWHGGEPMVLSPAYYRRAGAILDEIVPGHSESMQTSLIPYSSEWAEFVHERLGGGLGSSIDFSHRRIKGRVEDYHDLWMHKVEQARADGIEVIPGVVPGRHDVGRAEKMVEWFAERGFQAWNVDRYNQYGFRSDDWPTNAEHAGFLRDLFDAVMARVATGRTFPLVNVVGAALNGVLFDMPGDRWGGSCQSDFVVVNPDGTTNNCPDKTSFDKPFSDVADGPKAFLGSQSRLQSIRVQVIGHKRDHCEGCRYSSWCKSGCPITPNGPQDGEQECAGYRSYLDHVRRFASSAEGSQVVHRYLAATRRIAA